MQYRIKIEKDNKGRTIEVDVQERGWCTLWLWRTKPKWQYDELRGYKINLCETVADAELLIKYCKMRDERKIEYKG